MGQARNPIESLDELEKGLTVEFWKPVGGNMHKKLSGEVTDFGDLPRPHAVIEFDGENSPLAVGPEDIEKPN